MLLLLMVDAVKREVIQKVNLSVYCLKTIMAHTIGYGQVGWLEREIVTTDLRKGSFTHFDKRGFAFHQQEGSSGRGKDHDIRSFGQSVVTQACFNCKERPWIAIVRNQQVYEMLPDPFFRAQGNEFFSDNIENIRFPVYLFNFVIERREIQ